MLRSYSSSCIADNADADLMSHRGRMRRPTERWQEWHDNLRHNRHPMEVNAVIEPGIEEIGDSVSRVSTSSSSIRLKAVADIADTRAKLRYLEQETRMKADLERLQLMRSLDSAQGRLDAIRLEETHIIPGLEANPTHPGSSNIDVEHKDVPAVTTETRDITRMPAIEVTSPGQTIVTPSVLQNPGVSIDVADVTPHSQYAPLSNGNLTELIKAFTSQASLSHLPPPEPGNFSGDPLQYPGWVSAFDTLVERRGVLPGERLYYLKRYISGPAREAVEGHFLLGSQEAYVEAKALLKKRFGDPFVLADAFRDKLDSWNKIQSRDGKALRRLSDFMKQCKVAMVTIPQLKILDDERENRKITAKLPEWLINRWARHVVSCKEKGIFPTFNEFSTFIEKEAEIACDPITSVQLPRRDTSKPKTDHIMGSRDRPTARTLSTSTQVKKDVYTSNLPVISGDRRRSNQKCNLCQQTHTIDVCPIFLKMSLKDRKTHVMGHALCFACLKYGHMSRDCRGRKTCEVCKKKHPTSLHEYVTRTEPTTSPAVSKPNPTASTFATDTDCGYSGSTMIMPVWLSHISSPEREELVYALSDPQSDSTFVASPVAEKLSLVGCATFLKLSTMLASNQLIRSSKYHGLMVRAYDGVNRMALPPAFSRETIPGNRDHIPTREAAHSWTHLEEIADKLHPLVDCEIGILIGYDCPQLMTPRAVVPAPGDNSSLPFGVQTDLGWSIIGTRRSVDAASELSVGHATGASTQLHKRPTFAFKTRAREVIQPSDVTRMMEMDFIERSANDQPISLEDMKFIKIMTENIIQKDGVYEMPLPMRDENLHLPNNRRMCERRLQHLKSRLLKDPVLLKDYTEFMGKLIRRGYAEKVEDSTSNCVQTARMWFIPHHGIYQKSKLRVVFDCSARVAGISLNDNLLQGPSLTNTMLGLLCRFRKEPIVLACDVEQMFHQFKVKPEHRDYLRFLWWESGNVHSTPQTFRMTVHLFGARSSPGCASFGLRQIANDYESECGSEAARFVRDNFYVDDGLTSVPTEEAAISLLHDTSKLCAKGGLHLHKIASNSKKVIESVDAPDRAKSIMDLELAKDQLPMEKTLGVMWCLETDTFNFRILLNDRPLSRRGILSTISSVFDPMGFVAPVILLGKQILQELCVLNNDWDDPVPDDIRARWERWRNDLVFLKDVKVNRCFKGDLQTVVQAELHHFSDASNTGYGQCSYMRLIDDCNNVYCSFVIGKSRVTPRKVLTIPRLELTAAVTSISVSRMLNKELQYENLKEIFWTDSMVTLGYINNSARRFHVFVSNRVQQIHDASKPSQWRYVKTEFNPADDASRGLEARRLQDSRWLQGPSFLQDHTLPSFDSGVGELTDDDPEIKMCHVHLTTSKDHFDLRHFSRFSTWDKLRHAVSLCLIYMSKLKNTGTRSLGHEMPNSSVSDLTRADTTVVRLVQEESFANEYFTLDGSKEGDRTFVAKRKKELRMSSKIYRLDPYIDDERLLRVGGRLSRSTYQDDINHPVILPKKHHITQLIILHYHKKIGHLGRGSTLNEIRARGYWILHGCSAVSDVIRRCVSCRRNRGKVLEQKMADLPIDRLTPSPPFTYSGVDYFGPWMIKEGRKEMKRYGVLFTCMSSRAIHLETASSMDTSSFINAYRRFVAIRGPVRQLRSDCGTNFVGARNEFRAALNEMDHDAVRRRLSKEGCDLTFSMNVPSASHMGGVWERQIRSVRAVLCSLLRDAGGQLDDEGLRTLMYEVAAIVNSRPLTTDNLNDPLSLRPLTPNHLLTMKGSAAPPPPGVFPPPDLYSRRRWRRIQHLTEQFWTRWSKEYLQTLQPRQQWNKERRELHEGDVVIIRDENIPRSEWLLGRVEEVYPSEDGHVRKAKVAIGDKNLDKMGRRVKLPTFLERPIQKLVLLLESDQQLN